MRPGVQRLVERVEEATGYSLRPTEEVRMQESAFHVMQGFADEAEDLALYVQEYWPGRPQEMTATSRKRLAKRSRIALTHDPLAGAEADLRANFAFGRGVPKPQANDEEVQRVLDEAWDDPVNKRKLTGFEAQRHRSTELLAQANLFPVLFKANGKVRVGFLDNDLVADVVTHPEDDELPLYYVTHKRKMVWDYDMHQWKPSTIELEGGVGSEKVYYYAHWRHVDDAEEWAAEMPGMAAPLRPPGTNMAEGVVEHFRINRVGRTQFGTPPFARTLRFYSAMNQLTEAQVAMRQAASTIAAKRVRKGGPRDLLRAAGNVANQASELAATRFGRGMAQAGNPTGPGTSPSHGMPPPPAGSWWVENEADRLEAVRLSSGAGEAMQDAQLVRAPIAAAAGFQQGYFGDASNAGALAAAAVLELPALMNVGAWQETFEQLFRWFCDNVIEEAVKTGRLGGLGDEGNGVSLDELRMQEDKAEMEDRTGRDLSYSFEMPYPGRRNLDEVVGAVGNVATTFDPDGQNVWLRRQLLDFLFRHGFQLQDPARIVDEVMPEDVPLPEPAAAPDAPPSAPPDGTSPPQGDGGQSQYGERRNTARPTGDMGAMAPMQQGLREQLRDDELGPMAAAQVNQAFAELFGDMEALLAGRAPARQNGNGATAAHFN